MKSVFKPYFDVFRVVWPLALGMINNALLEFTDRIFLARESLESLEAILPASMLAYISLGFFQSVVAYSGTFVAQYYGAGNREMCRRSYHAGLLMAIVSGIVMVAVLPLGDLVFETFSNGHEIIDRQKAYFHICTMGGVFLFGQMAAQAYFTGLGKTRIVLWVNVIGNAINVVLDPVLIYGWMGFPKLGMAGAAYATVFSTFVQWIILVVSAHRMNSGLSIGVDWHAMARLVGRMLRYGVPSGAYSVLNSLSFTIFVFFTGAVGHIEAAVSNATFSVCYLLFAPMEGIALGAATLVGQHRGAGNDDEALKTGFRTILLGGCFAAVSSVIVLVFHRPILSLYAPTNACDAANFISIGSILFVLMALWQVFDATDVIVSGALKGAGDTRFVFWWILVNAFGFWLPLVWVVSRVHNTVPALWGTMVVYVVVLCIGSLVRWRRCKWKKIKLI